MNKEEWKQKRNTEQERQKKIDSRRNTEDRRRKTEEGRQKGNDRRRKTQEGRQKKEHERGKTKKRISTEEGTQKNEDKRRRMQERKKKKDHERRKTKNRRQTEEGTRKKVHRRMKTKEGNGRRKAKGGRQMKEDRKQRTKYAFLVLDNNDEFYLPSQYLWSHCWAAKTNSALMLWVICGSLDVVRMVWQWQLCCKCHKLHTHRPPSCHPSEYLNHAKSVKVNLGEDKGVVLWSHQSETIVFRQPYTFRTHQWFLFSGH